MKYGRWIRFFESDLDDARAARLRATTYRTWTRLLLVCSRCGSVPRDVEQSAFLLRMRPAALARQIAELLECGLLEERDGELRPEGFDERQSIAWTGPEKPADATNADRQRRWRERQKPADEPVTEGVTPVTAVTPIRDEKREEETQSAPAARESESADDLFPEFWSAFPKREGDNPEAPARAAWRKALAAGADPAEIIAGARSYAAATADRERKFIASAARWLTEARYSASGGAAPARGAPAEAGVWVEAGSPEWGQWVTWWRTAKGKSPPIDSRGGWRFPSLTPPDAARAAA
jgi:hypothetical protein